MTKIFVNTAKSKSVSDDKWAGPGAYGFDKVSPFLFNWSRLFQSVISQAGTYLLTGKFHQKSCAIYKCEGGCNLPGVNELVLCSRSCYFDWEKKGQEEQVKRLAELITYVVLHWDPMNPIDSMLQAAVDFLKANGGPDTLRDDLKTAIESSQNGGPFGGDALSSFFDWNPFSKAPVDREYLRFCLVNFNNQTEAMVDQKFVDEDLGEDLLKRPGPSTEGLFRIY